MTSAVKTALTIAGSDSIGGAGVQADLKAFASLGVHGCSVITCITAQNTTGIRRVDQVDNDLVREQIIAVLEDVRPGAVKTGAIYTSKNVKAIADAFSDRRIPLIIDPVLVSTTGAKLAKKDFVASLKKWLIPLCALITPNASEAESLTGIRVTNAEQASRSAEQLLSIGASGVLIKGIRDGEKVTDYLAMAGGSMQTFSSTVLPGEFHGTGCVLSALIAGHVALGDDICTSVTKARGALFLAMQRGAQLGKGIKIIDPLGEIFIEAGKNSVLESLHAFKDIVERDLPVELIPEVGSNLGYSIISPGSEQDVAGYTGRIVRDGKRPKVVGCPRFGASKHVARIILAASRYDQTVRSAMNIKFNDRNIEACRTAGLRMSSFSRDKEPSGVSTMDWGTGAAIKEFGSAPDAIWDEGGHGKEPMIRILGESPEEVLRKVSRVSSELRK
jgi:hydroxymethylpyrimidine kinase/phosphomethylpyrimidine kinase